MAPLEVPPNHGDDENILRTEFFVFLFFRRVMFGTSHLYVFHHPAEATSSTLKQADITYEMAQEEIAKNVGLDVDDQEESKGISRTGSLAGNTTCIIDSLKPSLTEAFNQ